MGTKTLIVIIIGISVFLFIMAAITGTH